jgi:F420-dependent methylenetetrahydromethanopterin dehydrogenase
MTFRKPIFLLSIPAALLPAVSAFAAPVQSQNNADLSRVLSTVGELRVSQSAGRMISAVIAADNNNNNNNNNTPPPPPPGGSKFPILKN